MDKLIINKDKIQGFIQQALTRYTVYAPVDNNGLILFKQIKTPDEVSLVFSNSKMPPKSLFFPQTETLFRFTKDESIKIDTPAEVNDKTMIFGIRPCDAKSLQILDMVFKNDYEDPYYLSKRKNTVLFGLSCTNPSVNCFCTSVNGSPDDIDGLDVLLTDLGDKYFIEIASKKGKQLIESFHGFKPATNEDAKKKDAIVEKARNKIKRQVNTKDVEGILDKIFGSQFWNDIAIKCLGCGICTYLCPTCHCFDIQDESVQKTGARIRVWDSCMYPEYSLQASGYNPRPTQMNRVRNRVYHKFNYFPKNHQVIGCVGCGRCIDACPVNIDVIDVVTKARERKS